MCFEGKSTNNLRPRKISLTPRTYMLPVERKVLLEVVIRAPRLLEYTNEIYVSISYSYMSWTYAGLELDLGGASGIEDLRLGGGHPSRLRLTLSLHLFY